jgi:hypothetical protein
MDNSDNDERIMEDIITCGANNVATYTYECSQTERFLKGSMQVAYSGKKLGGCRAHQAWVLT